MNYLRTHKEKKKKNSININIIKKVIPHTKNNDRKLSLTKLNYFERVKCQLKILQGGKVHFMGVKCQYQRL